MTFCHLSHIIRKVLLSTQLSSGARGLKFNLSLHVRPYFVCESVEALTRMCKINVRTCLSLLLTDKMNTKILMNWPFCFGTLDIDKLPSFLIDLVLT